MKILAEIPDWMDLLVAIFACVGGALGIVTYFESKKELLVILARGSGLQSFRVYNPMNRPIEIQNLKFELKNGDGTWTAEAPKSNEPWIWQPTILEPWHSMTFEISTSASLGLSFNKVGKVTVTVSSGKKFTQLFYP